MSLNQIKIIVIAVMLFFAGSAAAVTYTDNFSSATSTLSWNALNYACLTAGTSAAGTAGVIPGCSPAFDSAGSGALRLTPALNNQAGAILSNFTFPVTQGLQVTFTTYTYGGSADGTAKNGADGIAFFLTDGSKGVPTTAGGLGGSLGYSCSNGNSQYEGLANAYLGLGIDEYGNFLNSGDNTNSGITNTNISKVTTYGTNSFTNGSTYYQPERIGLRGAGNTTWAWLNQQNSDYYIGTTANAAKTQAACSSGQYVSSGTNASKNLKNIPYNYKVIDGGYSVLPNGTLIANESAKTRAGTAATGTTAAKPAATPITYRLTISASATNPLLNFAYSYNNGAFQPVLVNNSITSSNGALPASFRFGFSSGTGGSNNIHEITCFQAAPLQSNSSAGANTVQSGQLQVGSQLFLATYTTDNWWGSVVSDSVNVAADGSLSVSSVANWDANCGISGGACPSLGTNASGNATRTLTAQPTTSRTLVTWSGTAGSAFEWTNLTAAQKLNLNTNRSGVVDNAGATRLDWLRGGRANEQLASPTREPRSSGTSSIPARLLSGPRPRMPIRTLS
jgi:type IV pilus assembly protein PilY1